MYDGGGQAEGGLQSGATIDADSYSPAFRFGLRIHYTSGLDFDPSASALIECEQERS